MVTLKIFNHMFNFQHVTLPDLTTSGLCNETEDSYFVPFIDYDDVDYKTVLKDLVHLNKLFGLSVFIVCMTSEDEVIDFTGEKKTIGHYQIFGIDKLTFQEHLTMLGHTRCDTLYIGIARRYPQRHWVLRFAEKTDDSGKIVRPSPVVKEVIKFSTDSKYKRSTAHLKFYKKWFNIDLTGLPNQDGLKDLEIYTYATYSRKGTFKFMQLFKNK